MLFVVQVHSIDTTEPFEIGFSNNEMVYSFTVATDADDFTLLPSTSTDLLSWSFVPLEFVDAADLGGNTYQLRFRLTNTTDPQRLFRFGSSN